MTTVQGIWTIGRWEFQRFFKWRDALIGLLVGAALTLGGYQIGKMVTRDKGKPVKLAVIGGEALNVSLPADSRIKLESRAADDSATLRAEVDRGDRAGLLVIQPPDHAELYVGKEPTWKAELLAALSEARSRARLADLQIAPQQLADALRPMELQVAFASSARRSSTFEKVAAGVIIGLMMMTIFFGFAFFFVAVTGEKQNRVTEQVVAAVAPQAWVDGKLAGLTAASIANTAIMAVLAVLAFAWWRWSNPEVALPPFEFQPLLLGGCVLLALLGMLFWNCLFAAVAVSIDDPNTSARSSLMFLPMIPVGMAFFALFNPDGWMLRVLSVLPGSSSAVLPARMLLTDVAAWELPLAVVLLLAGTWLLRRAAGKIFATAILMYGKEPGWREMWRWVRQA